MGGFLFFLVFMFWAKCKYEAKPFLFFPPTMGQQTRPFFCLAVHQGCCGSGSEEQVYWHQESISGPALPLPALPFTCLGRQPLPDADFPRQEDDLLRTVWSSLLFLFSTLVIHMVQLVQYGICSLLQRAFSSTISPTIFFKAVSIFPSTSFTV